MGVSDHIAQRGIASGPVPVGLVLDRVTLREIFVNNNRLRHGYAIGRVQIRSAKLFSVFRNLWIPYHRKNTVTQRLAAKPGR